MKESEFEDTLNVDLYKGEILAKFGVSLNVAEFRSAKQKWSDRVAAAFRAQGKLYDSNVSAQVKALVSELVASDPRSALHPRRSSSIEALCVALESRLIDMGS